MVFGNRDETSGTGVGFTRNAATGEDRPYGDFLVNAQGEDVVAGIRNTLNLDDLGSHFPGVKDELLGLFAKLEAHYRDMCDTEFTIDQGKLWMLQTRVGKRTGRAALRMAVDMTNQRRRGWKISRQEALLRITEEHVEQVDQGFADRGELRARRQAEVDHLDPPRPGVKLGRHEQVARAQVVVDEIVAELACTRLEGLGDPGFDGSVVAHGGVDADRTIKRGRSRRDRCCTWAPPPASRGLP